MNSRMSSINPGLVTRFQFFSMLAALSVALFSIAVTAGWILDIEVLKRPIWNSGMLHGSVAIALALSAMSLSLTGSNNAYLRLGGKLLACTAAAAGAATLLENLSGLDLGLNHTWWQSDPDSAGLTFPGPMAPNVALSFMLLGLSLICRRWKTPQNRYPFQYLALAALALSAMPLIGYSCGALYLCTLGGCVRMPLAASLALITLSVAVIASAPETGIAEIFVRESPGGKIARRFGCCLITLPVLLWLTRTGEQYGLYDAAFGWTGFAVIAIGLSIVSITGGARSLDAAHDAATDAASRLETLSNSPESTGSDNRIHYKTVCLNCIKELSHNMEVCPDCGAATERIADDPLLGTIFAERYQIVALLGSGGMSRVYQAKHIVLGRTYAIKLMLSHMASNVKAVKRFQQEAKAASQLSHPNLITVHDFGFSRQGEPYLVMDYVDGACLADEIYQGPLAVDRACGLFIQVLDGLSEAHNHGVVHRDLKPDNIMIVKEPGGRECAIIVDFGLAKELEFDVDERLTKTGEIFGTPQYMSPEQCLGERADPRADIYALGCIMYECLCGRPPFDSETPFETIRMHLSESPHPLPENLAVPPWLDKAIFACLKKEKSLRPQSMAELRDYFIKHSQSINYLKS